MKHSKNFANIRDWYRYKVWNKDKVKNAVIKGWITEEEYLEITGEEYTK